MEAFTTFSVDRLADWLDANGAERLWTVDGDYRIGRAANLPCEGRELAKVLRELGGDVAVRGTKTAQTLDELMFDEDGARAFAMKWADEDDDDVWLLTEDLLAEEARSEASTIAAAH